MPRKWKNDTIVAIVFLTPLPMKRIYYLFLMMTLSVMITVSLYFSMIYVLVIYRVIPLRNIIEFTDLMLSRESYLIVASIGAIF